MWEHFAHQADIGIKAVADSLSSAFEEAALALTAIVTEPKNVDAVESVKIKCSGENSELLLVNWLNAVIYEMDVRKMLFSRFEVKIYPAPIVPGANQKKTDLSAVKPDDYDFTISRNNRCGVENLKLSATIWGEKISQHKHSPAVEPKAVTYNQLSVKSGNGKWTIQCVIDV